MARASPLLLRASTSSYATKHLVGAQSSFIRDLSRDTVDQQLVRAIVGVARGLGKRTIAEFVGDEETLSLLRQYGVDFAQGYHVGVPAPLGERLAQRRAA